MTLSITVDDTAIQTALSQLSARSDNLTPAMNDIGEALVTLIHGQLSQGQTPWGEDFEPLSADYLAARPEREGGVILNDTHQHLYNRINAHAGRDFVDVGILDNTETPGLALAHQFGSERNGLPPRPYLPIHDNQVDLPAAWSADVLDVIRRHLMG